MSRRRLGTSLRREVTSTPLRAAIKTLSEAEAIGTSARRHMERMFERKVFLKLWVKVREGWVDDENMLKKFGYTD